MWDVGWRVRGWDVVRDVVWDVGWRVRGLDGMWNVGCGRWCGMWDVGCGRAAVRAAWNVACGVRDAWCEVVKQVGPEAVAPL